MKMKRIIISIAIALVSLIGFYSCNDEFLELTPKGELNEASAFTSYETCVAFEKNLYSIFTGYTFMPGCSYRQSHAYGPSTRDVYSGLMFDLKDNMGGVTGSYASQNRTIPVSADSYSVPYSFIRTANIMLSHIDEPNVTDAQRERLEAVARFFRAYCHLALLINYGDCIYVDTLLGETSEELFKARDSRLFVADQIYNELKWCESHIHDELAEDNTVNSKVVMALMSRFCIFEGTWRKYHNVQEDSKYVTGNKLLEECVSIGKSMSGIALYQGNGKDRFPGQGWGQKWTTDDLSVSPSTFLYIKYIADYKTSNSAHIIHTASGLLNLPQSTVDLYLTQDGLPIHNANVKHYTYSGATRSYTEGPAYDYANCDPYLTFRKRDRRLWQTVIPPYSVESRTDHGLNSYSLIEDFDGKYTEFIHQVEAPEVETTMNHGDYYTIPNYSQGYHQIDASKLLPTGQWAGNLLPVSPSCNSLISSYAPRNGMTGYGSGKAYQASVSGYYVWKEYAAWDRCSNAATLNVADKPLFGLEEVLLNYAEAAYELGQFNQGVADETINRLRDRAAVGRMNVGEINDSFDPDRDPTINPVLWEIRRERLIELMGESFSFDDIRRWKKADWFINKQVCGAWVDADNTNAFGKLKSVTSSGKSALLNAATKGEATLDEAMAQGGGHIYLCQDPKSVGKGWVDKYYLEPIPSGEILLNENLSQNPGWE